MNSPLSLVVIRTAKLEEALRFYQSLGCEFVSEQHGTGPVHYSCKHESLVFEIYPGKPGEAPEWKTGGATMLGFKVADFDACLVQLQKAGVQLLTQPKDSPWGRYIMVADPDGRAVQVSQ